MWLQELKLALIHENVKELDRLTKSIPSLSSLEELNVAVSLMSQARELIMQKKSETLLVMQNIQKNKRFLQNDRIVNIHKYFDKNS